MRTEDGETGDMFVTLDNDDFVRINFSTNVDVVDSINPRAIDANAPVVSCPFTLGGYSYPILDDIAQGRHYQILKSTIPKDSSAHVKQLVSVFKDPETVYSYVDTSQITIVQIESWNRATDKLSDYGWTITSGQKTFKRLKTLNRPFRIWNKLDRKLRVAIVDDGDYSDIDLEDFDDETKERLLDGAFVISKSLYEETLQNLNFPIRDEQNSVDHFRTQVFENQAKNFKAFNARIFGEFEFIGPDSDDPFMQKKGMLKGQAFKHVSDICDRMKVDVIASRSALKTEVAGTSTFVLLEPQSVKFHANSDFQSITNNEVLYEPISTKNWVKQILLNAFEDLKNDKLLERWYKMDSPTFSSQNEKKYDENDLINLTKWNARAWVMSGMSLTQSPWLFDQMAKNVLSIIQTNNINKMRIPIPCAVRCQIVSQSLAAMTGYDMDILPGTIRWLKEHEVLVVSDIDWLEMYESHGGMDLDDFFVGYWRTVNNFRKVVVMRSPNDFGEYSIFDYVEGDWFPVEELQNNNFIVFPEVTVPLEEWPKRLSEAVVDGDVTYLGLPSVNNPAEPKEPRPYSMQDVVGAIENNVGSQSCVGANVNARSLWSLTMKEHRDVQLAPMESCIDTGAQGGHMDDVQAVTAEAQDILKLVLETSNAKIDEYIWKTRFMSIYQLPFDISRLTRDTHVFAIHEFRMKFGKSFVAMCRDYVSNHVGHNCDPRIHQLGARYLRKGFELLKIARYSLVAMQSSPMSASSNTWVDIHEYIKTEINKYEKESDRHDLILGLYSACLKIPTKSTGKISDQLVMNPDMFELLISALRFYGIAAHLYVDEFGSIKRRYQSEWNLKCTQCDFEVLTDDSLVYQSYHVHQSVCVNCEKSR